MLHNLICCTYVVFHCFSWVHYLLEITILINILVISLLISSTDIWIYRLLQYLPRFQPENLKHNKTLFERVNEMATRKGCTPSQLALAWVHHQGNDVCPIPGTTKIENFNQNIGALSVKLTPEEMDELESFATEDSVKGERYTNSITTWKDSETPHFLHGKMHKQKSFFFCVSIPPARNIIFSLKGVDFSFSSWLDYLFHSEISMSWKVVMYDFMKFRKQIFCSPIRSWIGSIPFHLYIFSSLKIPIRIYNSTLHWRQTDPWILS